MKKKIFIAIAFFISSLCLAQQNTFNKEAELYKFVDRGGKVEETSPNVYKLTYPDGLSRVFNLNRKENTNENLEGVDTTIINIWEIDTTKYAHKFSFWQKVGLVDDNFGTVIVEDLNNNGLPELYGYSKFSRTLVPGAGPVEIYEMNNDGIYDSIFSYDSNTIFVQGMGDIQGTGCKEIHIRTRDTLNGKFYRGDSLDPLPVNFDFIFYYHPNQIHDMTFGDFDYNNVTDCAFVDGSNPSSVIISEYDKDQNNFVTKYQYIPEDDVPSGFAIDDFDEDGKTELAFGTGNGNINIIENTKINTYEITWQDTFSTYNAYMKTATNDIDGNGKKEFWIGGQSHVQGISRFQCYESDGDDSYRQVAMIELRYLVSLNANYLQSADLDKDGTDELVISLGQYIIILKFTGQRDYHAYEIYYIKHNENTQPGAIFRPVTIYDLDRDGEKDILLPMDKYIAPNRVHFSYILKQNKPNSVKDENVIEPESFDISQNYPNPFNPITTINYQIPELSFVTLKVYDVLGNEIAILVNKEKPAGSYEVEFSTGLINQTLPSGIYFYQLRAGNFVETKKMVLMK